MELTQCRAAALCAAAIVLIGALCVAHAQENQIGVGGGFVLDSWPKNSTYLFLGGLFPITVGGVVQSKGLQRAEAFRCAMTLLNNTNVYAPQKQLFYHIEDDHDDGNYGMSRALVELDDMPLAIIGPSSSTVTDVVARLLASFGMPVVSYASSAASLSTIGTYPTLLRTVPSDNLQVHAMVSLCKRFNWNLVAALGTTDTYGSAGAATFVSEATAAGLRVLCRGIVTVSDPLTDFAQCVQLSGTKVIMLFTSEASASTLINTLRANWWWSNQYMFIASDSWPTSGVAKTLAASPGGSAVIKGSLGVIQNPGNLTDFANWWYTQTPQTANYEFFDTYWQTRFSCQLVNSSIASTACSPWSAGIAARSTPCLCDGSETLYGDSLNNKAALVMDAVRTVTYSLQQLMFNCSAYTNLNFTSSSICNANGAIASQDLLTMMRNIKFPGYTGTVSFSGVDRANAVYDVVQFNGSSWTTVGVFYGEQSQLNVTVSMLTWGTSDGSVPTSQATPTIVAQNSAIAIIVDVLATVGIIVALALIGYFYVNRNHRAVRRSSPMFCILTLTGNIFIYISLYMWAGTPNEALCVSKFWIMLVGFALMMGNLLAPTYRIYRIFTQGLRFKKMMTKDLLIMSSLVVAGEVLLLAIWTGVDPVYPQIQQSLTSVYYTYYQCGGHNATFQIAMSWIFIAYNASLLVAGCVLSYLTRKVYAEYNDSLFIALTMYNLSFCMAIMLPIYMTTSDGDGSDERRYIIRSLTIFLANSLSIALLFGPKVRTIYLNLRSESKSEMGVASTNGGAGTGNNVRGITGGQFKPKLASVIDENNRRLAAEQPDRSPRSPATIAPSSPPGTPLTPTSADPRLEPRFAAKPLSSPESPQQQSFGDVLCGSSEVAASPERPHTSSV